MIAKPELRERPDTNMSSLTDNKNRLYSDLQKSNSRYYRTVGKGLRYLKFTSKSAESTESEEHTTKKDLSVQ